MTFGATQVAMVVFDKWIKHSTAFSYNYAQVWADFDAYQQEGGSQTRIDLALKQVSALSLCFMIIPLAMIKLRINAYLHNIFRHIFRYFKALFIQHNSSLRLGYSEQHQKSIHQLIIAVCLILNLILGRKQFH